MANDFDQFDEPQTNDFDQFDQPQSSVATQQGAEVNTGSKWSSLNSTYDAKYNLKNGFLDALGGHESSNDINAHAKGSTAYGQFQMTDAAWKDVGIDPASRQVKNPNVQADAAGNYFSRILNGPANGDYELALRMYYQGAGASHEKLYSKESDKYVSDPRFAPYLNKHSQTNDFDQFDNEPVSPSEASGTPTDTNTPEEPDNSTQSDTETQGNWTNPVAAYSQPTIRAITGGAVNLANIPAEMADAINSATVWAGNKLGMGDNTYTPAPRVTTGDIEQGLGLQAGSLTPQSKKEKVGAALLPFLTPTGIESTVSTASTKVGKVVNSLVNNMASSAIGSIAAHSDKDDPEGMATDLALNTLGGTVLEGLSSAGIHMYKGMRAKEALSKSVATDQVLKANAEQTANDLTKADFRYTNALRLNAPEDEINNLRNDYLDKEEANRVASEQYNFHKYTSGLYNNNGTSKADYLADRIDFLREMNKKGANVGVKELSKQLANPLTGEQSPLLTQYGIKPNLSETVSKSFDNSYIGKLGEYLGIKTMDQAGKNASAANKVLTNLGEHIADKITNPDSIGWQSMVPVIEDLRNGQWEKANIGIKDLRNEMTQQKAYDEFDMSRQEFENYHKTLDDLNTMRKYMANSPKNKTSQLAYNIVGKLMSHFGLFHLTGGLGMVGVPIAKMLTSKLVKGQTDLGLQELSQALRGNYSMPSTMKLLEVGQKGLKGPIPFTKTTESIRNNQE